MTRKNWILLSLVLVLGGISFYLNKDWFAKDNIQIYHRSRPARAAFIRRKRSDTGLQNPAINPITFGFSSKLKLTSVKVIPLSDIQTNKFPHPIWYLISDSNSIPTKDFSYGEPIKGMRSAIKGAIPDPLEPGVGYRLLIETLNQKRCTRI